MPGTRLNTGNPIRTPGTRLNTGNLIRTPGTRVNTGNPVRKPGTRLNTGNPIRTPETRVNTGNPIRTPGTRLNTGNPIRTPGTRLNTGNPIRTPGTRLNTGNPAGSHRLHGSIHAHFAINAALCVSYVRSSSPKISHNRRVRNFFFHLPWAPKLGQGTVGRSLGDWEGDESKSLGVRLGSVSIDRLGGLSERKTDSATLWTSSKATENSDRYNFAKKLLLKGMAMLFASAIK
ncbi:predicted protein [Nematostella vectensis]|uniref:Uncharacterized protein n=1 Tax=Nematostella vectensis TaxID=45351 RepID=A7RET4_NEMVE|nr:predicted protein [Nematostella vectensis]|eukprot:XP_001642035.1 predicted protein [Nematostella vectensis]